MSITAERIMTTEPYRPNRQLEYYTLTPAQEQNGGLPLLPAFLNSNSPDGLRNDQAIKHFNSLVQKCIAPLKLPVFSNGDTPFSPTDKTHKEDFMIEARRVIATFSADCLENLGPDGFPIGKNAQTFFNLVEIAPELIKILTEPNNYIIQINKAQTLNLVAAALHKARNPEADLLIRMGIGGSDDEFTSARFPAYGEPALKIAEQIDNFYKNRTSKKKGGALVEKNFPSARDSYIEQLTNSMTDTNYELIAQAGLSLEAIDLDLKTIKQNIQENPDNYSSLTEIEFQTQVLDKFGVSNQPPRVQFFFAYHAAIAVNHTMDPEGIKSRSKENMKEMRNHVELNHPSINQAVEIIDDIHWEDLKPSAKVILEYMADLLRRSPSQTVRETLDTLQKLGGNHGGEKGAELAAEYAAMHPIAFGDRLNLPSINYLNETETTPTLNLTIGGRTERHFCAIREYLSQSANPEGLMAFIEEKKQATDDFVDLMRLTRLQEVVARWKKIKATNPAVDTRLMHGASLITKIGHTPTYYNTEFDRPMGMSSEEYDQYLIDQANSHLKVESQSAEDKLNKNNLRGTIFDMTALRRAQGVIDPYPKWILDPNAKDK